MESLERRALLAAPFALSGDPSVHPADFRVTTFAAGLDFPIGMQRLADGSILVATTTPNPGGNYFDNSVGRLLRLVDANADGVADGAPTVLATGLPGPITAVKQAGNLVFVTSPGRTQQGPVSITVLRKGADADDPYTTLTTLRFAFPAGWSHVSYALETRRTPGRTGRRGSFDVFFNIGSRADGVDTNPSNTVALTKDGGGFSGTVLPDSIYKFTVRDAPTGPIFYGLRQIATGLRNAAGIAIDPATGDLYFEDNGIDGPTFDPQLSADEINRIPAADVGRIVPDFGFASDYIRLSDGVRVGSGATQPVDAFPLGPRFNAQGPNDIAFAPAAFPRELNRGIFVGFFGKFGSGGVANDQNPVVFSDLRRRRHFEIVGNDLANIGHPVGLLSTPDSLFIADMASAGPFANGGGIIHQVQARPRPFSISGVAFVDRNGDGVRNGRREPARRGVSVYLDENNNGVLDAGERVSSTGKRGTYAFALPSGRYVVRQVVPAGSEETTPGRYIVKLGRTRHAGNINFGSRVIT